MFLNIYLKIVKNKTTIAENRYLYNNLNSIIFIMSVFF